MHSIDTFFVVDKKKLFQRFKSMIPFNLHLAYSYLDILLISPIITKISWFHYLRRRVLPIYLWSQQLEVKILSRWTLELSPSNPDRSYDISVAPPSWSYFSYNINQCVNEVQALVSNRFKFQHCMNRILTFVYPKSYHVLIKFLLLKFWYVSCTF